MSNREKIVGFDRTIQFNWIESAVEMLIQNNTPEEIWLKLDEIIKPVLTGTDARRKCKTVIFRIWIKVPEKDRVFRDEALELIKNSQPGDRYAIHWGMCCVAYTFFRDVNGIIGKMLKLHEFIDAAQLIRRTVENYGERETVIRSTQRLIASLRNWKVIDENVNKSIISIKQNPKIVLSERVQAWVIESMLRSFEEQSMTYEAIKNNSAYYPFQINVTRNLQTENPRLETFVLSSSTETVWLKR